MNAVLVAESEAPDRDYLLRQLRCDGFEVVGAERGGEALALAEVARPDVVVLGDPLPDVPAVEVCRRLRAGEPGRSWDRDVPVIVLDAAGADAVDRVRAFERGADDCLARPFAYDELRARIRAVLRRTAPPARDRLEAGEIVVDRGTRRVTVAGRPVPLAGREFELLCALAADPTRVFPKERLLKEVWGYRSIGRTRTVDSHASRLRRKLAGDGDGAYVVNVWGVGYKLLDELAPGRPR